MYICVYVCYMLYITWYVVHPQPSPPPDPPWGTPHNPYSTYLHILYVCIYYMGYIGTYYTCAQTCWTPRISCFSGVSGVQIWPKWVQNGVKMAQIGLFWGPKGGQNGVIWAPLDQIGDKKGQKWTQNTPKKGSWRQNTPKIDPKTPQKGQLETLLMLVLMQPRIQIHPC